MAEVDKDLFLGTWNYQPTSSVPHISAGVVVVTKKKETDDVMIDMKMKLGASSLGVWMNIGTSKIEKDGRFLCPNGQGGWHELHLDESNPNILRMTEYLRGKPIVSVWEKQQENESSPA
mmetsp:Transcript_9931/g.15345  ORF Transcript_9931/g.15345 Transcript_9931/m.15345 type:complete len:119 (+) Transcript_9931:38-394(+)